MPARRRRLRDSVRRMPRCSRMVGTAPPYHVAINVGRARYRSAAAITPRRRMPVARNMPACYILVLLRRDRHRRQASPPQRHSESAFVRQDAAFYAPCCRRLAPGSFRFSAFVSAQVYFAAKRAPALSGAPLEPRLRRRDAPATLFSPPIVFASLRQLRLYTLVA